MMGAPLGPAPMPGRSNPRSWALELAIVLLVATYYVGGNLLFESPRGPAVQNALDIVALQEASGLNVEATTQDFFEAHPHAMFLLVLFYAGPHFVLTFGFLAWAYWFRFESFPYVRNTFAAYTLSAFTFQWFFPVAPPRMVPTLGFADSVTETLPINAETPWISTLVNDVAAVPSVHTGWALLVAIFLIRLTRGPEQWFWLVYPGLIVTSVVATANHFVWDLVTAVAWLGMVWILQDAVVAARVLPRACPRLDPAGASTPVAAGGR